jgi:glycosyltransferase involved in cell wall biosynthesis
MVSRRTDIIPANDLASLIPAAVLKVLFRKKVVYDSHEWQSEQGDFSSKKQAFIRTIERIFLPFADQRITVSDSIAKLYMEVYGGSTFSVVRNLPEIGPIEYLEKISDKGAIQKREFLFAGMLGEGRDLINIITTFLKLGDKYALTIVGYGSMASELESMIPDKSNVTLLPAIPPDELVRFVSQFDFGIVGGEHGICASFDFSLPNKLFTYLGARLPVVGANLKEMGGLITKHGIGVTYDPRTPGSLENSIRELVALDYNDLTVAVDNLNKNLCWEQESLVLKSTYDEIYLSTKKEG